MKLARNLVLGLTLLVLLYGGVYWFFARMPVRNTILFGSGNLSDFEKRWHKFFAPAAEIDIRVTYDRHLQKLFRGHWTNPETGDFVTIAGNDTFTFQLGKTRSSGQANLDREYDGYYAEFPDGDRTRCFLLYRSDAPRSGKAHDITIVATWIHAENHWESERYETELTRTPAP